MVSSIDIALTGLNANKTALRASASNIANYTNTGSENSVYKPVEVQNSSLNIGGVRSEIVEKEIEPAYISRPSSPFADSQGFVATPDISLEEEIVNMMTAKIAYKANLETIKAQQEMEEALLDAIV